MLLILSLIIKKIKNQPLENWYHEISVVIVEIIIFENKESRYTINYSKYFLLK